jgi:hypothetical protein
MKQLLTGTAIALLAIMLFALMPFSNASSEEIQVQWEKEYTAGYMKGYIGENVIRTFDGGFAIAGRETEYHVASRGPGSWISKNGIILKCDSAGNLEWKRNYVESVMLNSIIQTSDGGYALSGTTESWAESWFAKTDSNGNVQWSKTFLSQSGYQFETVQTEHEGFLIGGYLRLTDDQYTAVLLKIDATGNLLWNKTYTKYDCFRSIKSVDNGYVMLGITNAGAWPGEASKAVKISFEGTIMWEKNYNVNDRELFYAVSNCSDRGYILSGRISAANSNQQDIALLVKTDANGNLEWRQTYEIYPNSVYREDFGLDETYSQGFVNVLQTVDGGYVAAGYLFEGRKYTGSWLLFAKTDEQGNLLGHLRYNSTDSNPSNYYQFGDNQFESLVAQNENQFAVLFTYEDNNAKMVAFTVELGAQRLSSPIPTEKPANGLPDYVVIIIPVVIISTIIGFVTLYFKKHKQGLTANNYQIKR